MALRDQLPSVLDEAVLRLHKSTVKMSVEKEALMRAQQQKVNYKLTLGAALGAALGSGCRVRQGGLRHTTC